MVQAGAYSDTLHYLKAVQALGPAPAKVTKNQLSRPVATTARPTAAA
jgi:hypothetical protein